MVTTLTAAEAAVSGMQGTGLTADPDEAAGISGNSGLRDRCSDRLFFSLETREVRRFADMVE